MILLTLIGLSVGLLGLYFGAKFIIESLENIGKRYGISELMLGLTVLSIGTSLPEIAVSVIGGIDIVLGVSENVGAIVIGNKVGSFFTQITLILGILGLSQAIFVSKWEMRREGGMMIVAFFIFLLCSLDGVLVFYEGIILIISYIAYLIFIIKSEKKLEKKQQELHEFLIERDNLPEDYFDEKKPIVKTTIKRDAIIFLIGLVLLLGGAEFTLLFSHELALIFGIPDLVIGILIVGLGTSLPELVADMTAIKRESSGIAVGDILGSNICDILFATGSGAVITNFEISSILLVFDLPFLLFAILASFYFLANDKSLSLRESFALIGIYALYTVLKLLFFQI